MFNPKRVLFAFTVLLGLGAAQTDARALTAECRSKAWPNSMSCIRNARTTNVGSASGSGSSSSTTAHRLTAELVKGSTAVSVALDNNGSQIISIQDSGPPDFVVAEQAFTTTSAGRPRQLVVRVIDPAGLDTGSFAEARSFAWPNLTSATLRFNSGELALASDSIASSASSTSHFMDCRVVDGISFLTICVALDGNGQVVRATDGTPASLLAPASRSFITTAAGRPRAHVVTARRN
jgi:hypothetical protein